MLALPVKAMGTVDCYDLQRIVLCVILTKMDKSLDSLWRRSLPMPPASQLDILAVIVLHSCFVIEPAGVGQVYPEPNLHFIGLHGIEEHVWCEPILHCNLVIIFLIQGGFKGKKSE